MGIEHLLAFNLALLAAIISPGPALLVAIQTTLNSGRMAGIAIGCGLALMASIWTLMALLGLEIVFRLFPFVYTLVKITGAVYLLYIAWQMWRDARKPIEQTETPARRSFRQGFMINILNPKAVLFAAAVLVVIFPSGMSLLENAIIVANHFVIEVICYSILAFVISTSRVREWYLGARKVIDRVAALILSALGLRLLMMK